MDENEVKEDDFSTEEDESTEPEGALNTLSETELEGQLGDAIDSEDYELASKIRDEINKRRAN
jgi:protein-arginine kinase activator protein McsA